MSTASFQLNNPSGARAMGATASKRMIWKEVRQNVPLLVIFVAVLIITLAILTSAQTPAQAARGTTFWFPTIWSFVNVFALTIGVFLFAPEKENRTAQMLCQLPITSGFVVRTKLWMGAATVLAFVGIAVLLQVFEVFALGHRFEWPEWYQNMSGSLEIFGWTAVAIVVPIEFFVLGALCSLFIKRTIFAVVIATGGFLLSWLLPPLLTSLLPTSFSSQELTDWYPVIAFVAIKCLIYLAVLSGLIYGGRRWLGNSPQIELRTRTRDSKSELSALAEAPTFSKHARPTSGRIYSSLIWQSFRQNRMTLLIAVGIGIPFAFFVSLVIGTNATFGGPAAKGYFMPIMILVLPLIGALLAFSKDHQDCNYRFFQQHVEHARRLWLARLIPPALLTMICTGVMVFFIFAVDFVDPFLLQADAVLLAALSLSMLVGLAAFCIGQFCSMFFRSGVFSFGAALILACLASAWGGWLCYLNSSPWLFLAPIILGMLAITWWRAPAWLADRNRITELALPWLALVFITISTVTAFAVHRIGSVPDTGYSSDWIQKRYASLGQRNQILGLNRSRRLIEAAKLARFDAQAMGAATAFVPEYGLFPLDDENAKERLSGFLEANQKSMTLIHETDGLVGGEVILDSNSKIRRREQVSRIRFLMAAEASLAELDGDLELALKHWLRLKRFDDEYPVTCVQPSVEFLITRWSDLPGQSHELIKKAIHALEYDSTAWTKKTGRYLLFALLDFDNWYADFKNGKLDSGGGMDYGVTVANWPVHLMPWEMERSKRIAESTIIQNSVWRDWFFPALATHADTSFAAALGTDFPTVIRNFSVIRNYSASWIRNATQDPNLFLVGGYGTDLEVTDLLWKIQTSRYVRVRMALRAWQLEHGTLPDRLSQLVPEYFDRLPVDVFYGREFFYSPAGKDAQVGWDLPIQKQFIFGGAGRRDAFSDPIVELGRISLSKDKVKQLIPPNTPFLLPWTAFDASNRYRYQYKPDPDSDLITNECYDLSDPRDSIAGHPFYETYQLKWDDSVSRSDEKAD